MAARHRLSEHEDPEIRTNTDYESETDLEKDLDLNETDDSEPILMSLRMRTSLKLVVLLQGMVCLLQTEHGSRAMFRHSCIFSVLRNQE